MPKKKGKTSYKRKGPAIRRKTRRKLTVGPLWIVVVLLFLGFVLAIPYLKESIIETGAPIPELAMSGGDFTIDVSHYQGEIKWDSLVVMVNSEGRTTRDMTRAKTVRPVVSAVIKATEGETMVDPAFAEYWEGAGTGRIKRGAYHFYRSSRDPLRQARNFIGTVGELRYSDLPPVLDVETMHKGCSKKKLNEGILIWLQTVEKEYGRKPVIYSSESFLRDNISREILAGYPVWVAHYGVEKPGMTTWKAWQFTDKAIVHGVDGRVDLSIFK